MTTDVLGLGATLVGPQGPQGPTGNTGPAFPTPGTTTQVIFNDAGAAAGDAGFTYDKTADLITLAGLAGTGSRLVNATPAGTLGTQSLVITERTASVAVGNQTLGNVTATCLSTEIVVGGGFNVPQPGAWISSNHRSGNGWRIDISNATGVTVTLVAYVMCLAI